MMATRKLILRFPPELVEEPVTYHLVKDFGLMVNILRASISPGKQGRLVVAVTGEEPDLQKGLGYLKRMGLEAEPMAEEILRHEALCTSCTACIPACPTGALEVDRTTWLVSLDKEKCVLCGSCVPVCPYRAMEIRYNGSA